MSVPEISAIVEVNPDTDGWKRWFNVAFSDRCLSGEDALEACAKFSTEFPVLGQVDSERKRVVAKFNCRCEDEDFRVWNYEIEYCRLITGISCPHCGQFIERSDIVPQWAGGL